MSSHKPGGLKQSNKKHKGSTGKRAQNRSFGEGRISSTTKAVKNNTSTTVNERQNRINRNNQIKKVKGANSWLQKRIGSSQSCPKVVGILSLSDKASSAACLQHCLYQSTYRFNKESLAESNIVHSHHSAFKTRCTFLKPVDRDLFSSVDVAKLADIIMFVVDVSDGETTNLIDEVGLSTLSALKALGCPEVLFCVLGLDGSVSKANLSLKKATQQYIDQNAVFPGAKIVEAFSTNGSSSPQLVRTLCNLTPKNISWRATRSYVVSDSVVIQPQEENTSGDQTDSSAKFRVQVSGYLRGMPMSVHSLMHILGVGSARLVSAFGASPSERHAEIHLNQTTGQTVAKTEFTAPNSSVIHSDKSKQDSLVMSAVADTIAGEQTWPTEAELNATDMNANAGRSRRNITSKIPVGMSSYQADWFQDEDGNVDFDATVIDQQPGEEGEVEPIEHDAEEGLEEDQDLHDEDDDLSMADASDLAQRNASAKQMMRAALAQDEKEFPDEMQTPSDMSARLRFARYRALQSFRASPWHPKENLPQDYAGIFQFENFNGTQRRILADNKAVEQLQDNTDLRVKSSMKASARAGGCSVATLSRRAMEEDQATMQLGDEDDEEGEESAMAVESQETVGEGLQFTVSGTDDFIRAGQYVHFQLEDVPADVVTRLQQFGYLALFGMHQHENKLSVMHFSVQRCPENEELIRSKDPLLFQAGFRSFMTKPVFSESNLNCDKHKFERFLLNDRFSMASCYGPISYSPCPLLVFKQSAVTGLFTLVATGSLSSVDPDRIMLKKIILTGIPIRVRKKYAVVRHMFYEPQDVRWFKPAELVSKHGLRGHIREPIGTHGLLKAYFSGPIKQNDTVMLILYKRVFPKFPSEGLLVK